MLFEPSRPSKRKESDITEDPPTKRVRTKNYDQVTSPADNGGLSFRTVEDPLQNELRDVEADPKNNDGSPIEQNEAAVAMGSVEDDDGVDDEENSGDEAASDEEGEADSDDTTDDDEEDEEGDSDNDESEDSDHASGASSDATGDGE